MNNNVYAVIMAGGGGTRFWPLSKQSKPKQFLSISSSGETMIEMTAKRAGILSLNAPYVLTNKRYKELVRKFVPSSKIICEPVSRNTAPPIGLSALFLLREDKNATMIVLPSDHVIKNLDKMKEIFDEAVLLANKEKSLVTIGINPDYPHTGYGYIEVGNEYSQNVYKVKRFVEKPNIETAKKYIESQQFFWNSGMFVWRADVILENIKKCMPNLYDVLMVIDKAIGSDSEEDVIAENFPKIIGESIDYGVMEKASNVFVVRADNLGWNDVGSFKEWGENFLKDEFQNVVIGDSLVLNSKNSVCVNEGNIPTFLLGLDNVVVINTGNEVLVCNKDKAQDVKILVEELKKRHRDDLL